MSINQSISILISQGLEELTTAQISIGLKIMVIFGFVYLFNVVTRTGGSIISLAIYIIALLKWIIFKIMRKDV